MDKMVFETSTIIAAASQNTEEEVSEGEQSDDGMKLKIVIESPVSKRRPKTIELAPDEKVMIERMEKDIEQTLKEKAAKTNLTTNNVKNILKHVVTNEHVLAMVRQTEDPGSSSEHVAEYEPKLTRAKAKELFSSASPVNSIPWIAPAKKKTSETVVLISGELQEDSSGDEYVPAEEESEDDHDSSFLSETEPSLSEPSTPKTIAENSAEVNWSEDGIFKIPRPKTKEEEEEEANIALRTRSKVNFTETPVELIAEDFIPPDITTDMYDMDCDDEDWKDFLKKFMRPLDEVTREDEDHDPEYNILADEEMNKVDKEDFRADKAVKVTRKELNDLIAELFEYSDIYTSNLNQNKTSLEASEPQFTVLENEVQQIEVEITNVETPSQGNQQQVVEKKKEEEYLTPDQLFLIQQQMRQHVQLLTQNFLLTYCHPEYHDSSSTCKEYLMNLKLLGDNKENSTFHAHNLQGALELVENWERKFSSNSEEVENTKKFVARVLDECKTSKMKGTVYVPAFPPLILETVSSSDVFLYTSLLPRIPYKPSCNFSKRLTFFPCEDELIAIGLEQFFPFCKKDPHYLTQTGQVNLKSVAHFVWKFMMPSKNSSTIYTHILDSKKPRCKNSPIKYYFEHGKAPFSFHYIVSLNSLGIMPPNKRDIESLPLLWKEYIYPNEQVPPTPLITTAVPVQSVQTIYFDSPQRQERINRSILPKPGFHVKAIQKKVVSRKITFSSPKKKLEKYFKPPFVRKKWLSTLVNSNKKVKNFKFNSSVIKKLNRKKTQSELSDIMLPSMPSLLGTPVKSPMPGTSNSRDGISENIRETVGDSSTLRSTEGDTEEVEIVCGEKDEDECEKDNPEDIDSLMMACTQITNKPQRKRTPTLSGPEKRKAKMRKDFTANLRMLSPEDDALSEEKADIFAHAYYDKVRETLDVDDYHKFMEILNDHDENVSSTAQLYKKLEPIFVPKHPDLADEFLTFMSPADAKAVGKLVPYFMLNKMSVFLRKLETYFKDQPFQVRKIYRSLNDLTTCVDVTMGRIKNTILPLLKGNKHLIDWFLQIFPCEPPPTSFVNGPYDSLVVPREPKPFDENLCEHIVVPEIEDPYGGPNCICNCHSVENEAFKARTRHCIPCGTKFLQGRVYVQTGRGLRLANITFDNVSRAETINRLMCRPVDFKRRRDRSPCKQVSSPVKESHDEIRLSNDSDEESAEKKKRSKTGPKSPRKRKAKATEKIVSKTETIPSPSKTSSSDKSLKSVVIEDNQLATKMDDIQVNEQEVGETKLTENEGGDWDGNTSIESVELKLSPEHSADSGSEYVEESSQDNINSDSGGSDDDSGASQSPSSEDSNSNTFEDLVWTRDEDKIILETFRKENSKAEALKKISEILQNRNLNQIKYRFKTLMSLLQQMSAGISK